MTAPSSDLPRLFQRRTDLLGDVKALTALVEDLQDRPPNLTEDENARAYEAQRQRLSAQVQKLTDQINALIPQ
jgi:hypothetical protein